MWIFHVLMAWEFGETFSQWSASWWNLSGPGHSSDASAERNNREVSNNDPLVTAFNPIGGFDFDWENTVKSQPQI